MSSQTEVSIQEFVSKQKQLLESELRAEEDNNDNSSSKDGGFILRNIDVINTSVGLYGRTVVSFGNTIQQQHTTEELDNDTSTKENGGSVSKLLLPAHRLTVGDEIQILPNNGRGFKTTKKSKAAGGVICACDDVSISVALFGADNNKVQQSKSSSKKTQDKKKDEEDNEDDEDMLGGNPPYAMIPKSNIEVHNKMISSLDQLAKQGIRHPIAGDVVLAAFEPNTQNHNVELTRLRIETLESELDLKSTKLDYSQREAVVMALHSNSPINLIHGPPGTGKTTTVAELIRCAVHNMGWKVLVTAPSNIAVDNVLERVMSIEHEKQDSTGKRRGGGSKKTNTSMKKVKAVRLGHPARIQHGIQKYSLESLVQSSEGTEIVQDCRSELNNHLKTLSNPKSRGPEKRVAYKEMKALKKEIRTREEKVVGEILRNSNVVLATNVGAASSLFNRMSDTKGEPISFDLVIIDEAAQALEASCWIPLLRGKRAVLVGDHKQLPPTIKCNVREVQQGLGRTLFERLMLAYDNNPNCRSKMLEVQYRMHKDISDWASEAMYNGKLISHDSVKDRQLSTLPVVSERMATQTEKEEGSADELENVTMMLIDTTGCDMHETANDAGSRFNEGEANIVVSHVHSLIKLGLRAQDIAVITPYNGQVELLRKLLLPDVPKLEIRSVDGFQGGEREAVVLSLVRSSEKGGQDGIGFLSDERRLNVAITRAKRHVAVICDCETVSKNKFIKGLIDWLEEKGDHRSGVQYNVDDTIVSSESLQVKISSTIEKQQKQSTDNKQKHPKNSSKKQPSTNSKNTFPKTDKMEYSRAELMQRITLFSQQGQKGRELNLSLNSEYDCVIAKELATQLGLGCRDSDSTNKVVLSIIKETKTIKPITAEQPTTEDKEPSTSTTTSKFAQLDMGDDSSVSSVEESKPANTPNNLLRELALEREKRQSQQPKAPSPEEDKPSVPSKKKKTKNKKGNNEKGKAKKEDEDDQLDDLTFLDAQIDKVQNSHGRKIEAKGKGYRSIVNGVLLSTPQGQTAAPKKNKAASCSLQDKLKAKAQDRTAKKKKKKK